MESSILRAIDELIERHKKENRNEDPLYIILSTDESKAVTEEIRKIEKYPPDQIITSYRDIKIAPHPSLLNGKRYVSNELPETGS
ncbi:MAG TPA: hypothetical protein VD884_02660 [Ohtaekwangia sp.]|nr:hypothetical protein [Ohtaekwangia sp.]